LLTDQNLEPTTDLTNRLYLYFPSGSCIRDIIFKG